MPATHAQHPATRVASVSRHSNTPTSAVAAASSCRQVSSLLLNTAGSSGPSATRAAPAYDKRIDGARGWRELVQA